jgi:hypothetical protein
MLRCYKGPVSFSTGSKIQRFHDKFVIAAIEHDLADFADLAFDDRIVLARKHLAGEHGARGELPGSGIELNADVWGNHRAQNGDVMLVIHAQKDEEQRLRLAARSDGPAKQEQSAGDKRSSHWHLA